MAAPAKSPLRIVAIIVVVVLCAFGAFSVLRGGNDKPAGVPDDAYTLRFIQKSGDKYDMQTTDDDQYTMGADHFEVYGLDEDAGRDFLSRDQKTLWLRPETAGNLGLNWDELEPADGENS